MERNEGFLQAELLTEIQSWVHASDGQRPGILWLRGLPGVGKSLLSAELRSSITFCNTKATEQQKEVVLKTLVKKARKSSSEVQHYINLGWIGVLQVLSNKALQLGKHKWHVHDLNDLWQAFYSTLLLLQSFLLALEQFFTIYEKELYLNLLYFSLSEFPNRLRPPCTTMPWTIWPALVVLWGVCWMFYDEIVWNWEVQDLFPAASDMGESSDTMNPFGLFQVFDSNPNDMGRDMSLMNEPYFESSNPEQQPLLYLPANCGAETLPISSVADAGETNTLVDTNLSVIAPAFEFTSNRDTEIIQETAEDDGLEAIDTGALTQLNTPMFHGHPQNHHTVLSGHSRHGQTEKYFCTYSDCIRSQPGSGFRRKDHLDQHLRGPHKQNSVPRIRGRPATSSSARNPIATSEVAQASLQSKKRNRESQDKSRCRSEDSVFEALAEERRLRLLCEQENQRLLQKVENCEGRLQKCEERLDNMMILIKRQAQEKIGE